MSASSSQFNLLIRYLAPHRRLVATLAALLLCSTALQLVNPQIVRSFIDAAVATPASGSSPPRTLTLVALLYLGIAVASQLVSIAETYVAESLGWTATNAVREDMTAHCLALDMSFHAAHSPGELIERLDGDVTALANFFSRFVLRLVASGLLLAGAIALLFREDVRVGLAVTLLSVLSVIVLQAVRPIGSRYASATRQASADLFGFLEERLGGLLDIRAVGAEAHTVDGLTRFSKALFLRARAAAGMSGVLGGTTGFVMSLATIVTLAFGAYFYRAGSMSLGTVYLLFQYAAMLRQPLGQIAREARDFQEAGASIGRVNELVTTRSRLQEAGMAHLPDGPLSVEFDEVVFGYHPDQPVIRGLSFAMDPGQVVGIMGRTGSGKSTVARLVLRLYDVEEGSVRLGGIDVRDISLDSLYRRVGVITQEVHVFHASVRDNVTVFSPMVEDDRIAGILEDVGLGPWLHGLPDGLDTVLSSGSASLSAGEAQLLAFSRLFLRDPDVVVLDEASSRLDPATDLLFQRAMDRLLLDTPRHGTSERAGTSDMPRRRTALVIAHRPSTLQNVDRVVLMEGGLFRGLDLDAVGQW